jgi:hypothetical protein
MDIHADDPTLFASARATFETIGPTLPQSVRNELARFPEVLNRLPPIRTETRNANMKPDMPEVL